MKNQAKEKGKRRGWRGSQGPSRHRVGPGEGPRAGGRERAWEGERHGGRREGTGRETGGADTALMCGTGWGLAHRSGVWQYYGMERP